MKNEMKNLEIPNTTPHISCFHFQCDVGPFVPGIPTDVPVWVAINLKQRQKCRINPPEWMTVGMTNDDQIRSVF